MLVCHLSIIKLEFRRCWGPEFTSLWKKHTPHNLFFRIRFGIFETDYEDERRTRTAKASAFWYRNLATTRVFDIKYEPTLEKLTF